MKFASEVTRSGHGLFERFFSQLFNDAYDIFVSFAVSSLQKKM
jgi:hypothetical protein